VLLIAAQRPDATRVAGIRTWNGLNRHVRKGEHGIAILAPCVYRSRKDDAPDADRQKATAPTDPGDAEPMPRRELQGFRVVHVFDVTQTDGTPLPDVQPQQLAGQAPTAVWEGLVGLTTDAGYRLERRSCPTGVNGWTAPEDRLVVLADDLAPAQATKTLAHELGHIRANHAGRFPDYGVDRTCRGAAEVEAESVAYVVTTHLGMETAAYSVPYIAGWADDIDVLRHHMSTVVTVAQGLLGELERLAERPSPGVPGLGQTLPTNSPVRAAQSPEDLSRGR
jgi:antirestriction protein ArdC